MFKKIKFNYMSTEVSIANRTLIKLHIMSHESKDWKSLTERRHVHAERVSAIWSAISDALGR